jgi:hypothetical protein
MDILEFPIIILDMILSFLLNIILGIFFIILFILSWIFWLCSGCGSCGPYSGGKYPTFGNGWKWKTRYMGGGGGGVAAPGAV